MSTHPTLPAAASIAGTMAGLAAGYAARLPAFPQFIVTRLDNGRYRFEAIGLGTRVAGEVGADSLPGMLELWMTQSTGQGGPL